MTRSVLNGLAVSGATTLTGTATGTSTVRVKGAASQTADLQEWRDASDTLLVRITTAGSLVSTGAIAHGIGSSITSGVILTVGSGANTGVVPLVARGAASQTADLQQWQDNAGNKLVAVNPSGTLLFGNSQDTNLYRNAVSELRTDDVFISARQISTDNTNAISLISASNIGYVQSGQYGGGTARPIRFTSMLGAVDYADLDGTRLRTMSSNGLVEFGSAGDTNLYRDSANTLKTDDTLIVAADQYINGTLIIGLDTNLYRYSANILKTDDLFLTAGNFIAQHGSTDSKTQLGGVGPSGQSGLTFGELNDTNLYRSAAGVLKTDDLFDASTAGLRTKHESVSTPTGGSSGEVRVGTDKLWFQDAGTWKSSGVSVALASATPPDLGAGEAAAVGVGTTAARDDHEHRLSFASMSKWNTD